MPTWAKVMGFLGVAYLVLTMASFCCKGMADFVEDVSPPKSPFNRLCRSHRQEYQLGCFVG